MAHSNGIPLVRFTNGNPRANAVMQKLAAAQEEAFWKAAKTQGLRNRSIRISRGITSMCSTGVKTEAEMKELLAAKALGLMQSLTYPERSEFLRSSSGRIMAILGKEDAPAIFMGNIENSQEREERKAEIFGNLSGYDKLAKDYFEMLRYVCLLDVAQKDGAEYHEMYAMPIISGEMPRAVIYERLLDLATDPETKIRLLGNRYTDGETMELYKTMIKVWYPMSDAIGLGTTQAVEIRRNATRMLEKLLRKKVGSGEHTQADTDMLELYERCVGYCEYIEPMAKRFQAEFINSGKLQGIVDALSKRFGLEIALASHTSNSDDVSRLKGHSGVFWKIYLYKKKAEKAMREGDLKTLKKYEGYDINRIPDIVAATMVIKGTFDDAKAVADRLVVELRQQLKAREFEVDSLPRDTGYTVPHVTCKVKFGDDELPFEIQVRPAEIHEEAKTGGLSHAAKISGFITGELIGVLKTAFEDMQSANDTQNLAKASLGLGERSEKTRYKVRIYAGKTLICDYTDVLAAKGECIGGVVALACGFSKGAMDVANGAGKNLDLFEECPGEITITLKKGDGINRETCKLLMDGKVITPEALGIVTEYSKTAPSKKWPKK